MPQALFFVDSLFVSETLKGRLRTNGDPHVSPHFFNSRSPHVQTSKRLRFFCRWRQHTIEEGVCNTTTHFAPGGWLQHCNTQLRGTALERTSTLQLYFWMGGCNTAIHDSEGLHMTAPKHSDYTFKAFGIESSMFMRSSAPPHDGNRRKDCDSILKLRESS